LILSTIFCFTNTLTLIIYTLSLHDALPISVQEHVFDKGLTFNQLVIAVYQHPKILKNPIVFNEQSLVTGFNIEDIGIFVPSKQRKRERLSLLGKLYTAEFT